MAVAFEQRNNFRAILTGKREELEQDLRRRGGIAIERSPDATDEIQYASERELAIQNLGRESDILHEVKAALERLEDGRFGICLMCEEAIGANRLAAVPWSQHCIRCQASYDRERSASFAEELSHTA